MGIKSDARDEQYMQLAMEQAQLAALAGEVPVGAVVVCHDEVIARAHNQVIMDNNPAAHAEQLALSRAGQVLDNYRLIDCELYVTLEPCTMCAGACVHSRIQRLVFGAHDLKTGAIESVDQILSKPHHNHMVNHTAGVLGPACGQLLSDFFAARRAAKKAAPKTVKTINHSNSAKK